MSKGRLLPMFLLAGGAWLVYTRARQQAESLAAARAAVQAGTVQGLGSWSMSRSSVLNIARTVGISAIPIVGSALALKRVAQQSNLPPSIKKIAVAGATMAIPIVGSVMVTQGAVRSRGRSVVGSSTTSVTGRTDSGTSTPSAVSDTAQDVASGAVTDLQSQNPLNQWTNRDGSAPADAAPAASGSKLPWLVGGGAALIGSFFMFKH